MPYEFFSMSAFCFKREQIEWVLPFLHILKEGEWVKNPIGQEEGEKRKPLATARHEMPCLIAAEIEMRLMRCGKDGLLVKAKFCWNEDVERFARHLNLDINSVDRRVNNTLNYVSGWKRKERSYKDYVGRNYNRTRPEAAAAAYTATA